MGMLSTLSEASVTACASPLGEEQLHFQTGSEILSKIHSLPPSPIIFSVCYITHVGNTIAVTQWKKY